MIDPSKAKGPHQKLVAEYMVGLDRAMDSVMELPKKKSRVDVLQDRRRRAAEQEKGR